ncbi:NAD(P)-dependent dehydrogenase (short-subunit alcohol dehydrogenase family) [Massilia violacea]|uniref:NAD(P)-dependent dehydrogenase (Short-subunit alcohol dehydrogenase family) n=1 Tax=Pseudoduganella violacea TaxID=1715466 RepID=A0A7W5FT83_9BURK|nr:NAD(P)-dependent dehydrogenase (short-subunit alcohol dehydrogenase family) [Pseudoduganella violacea]
MNEQRVALVTGGMGGLGGVICRRLARDGLHVITTYSPANAGADAWLAAQRADGFDFAACRLDVGDFAACEQGVARLLAEHGQIDVLVNNAGITRDQTLRKMGPELWREVLRTNLDSVYNMSRQVIEGMQQRRWGRIVNISSVVGQKGAFGQVNYAAAKAGMHGFCKALALEWRATASPSTRSRPAICARAWWKRFRPRCWPAASCRKSPSAASASRKRWPA